MQVGIDLEPIAAARAAPHAGRWLRGGCCARDRSPNGLQEMIVPERFDDIFESPILHGADRAWNAAVSGHDDYGQLGIEPFLGSAGPHRH